MITLVVVCIIHVRANEETTTDTTLSRSTFLLTRKIHCLEFHCTCSNSQIHSNKVIRFATTSQQKQKGQEFKPRTNSSLDAR
jgi:hypothetical protein